MTRKNGNGKAPDTLPEIKKQMTKYGAGANGSRPALDSGPGTCVTLGTRYPRRSPGRNRAWSRMTVPNCNTSFV